jgi:hypothetical protein
LLLLLQTADGARVSPHSDACGDPVQLKKEHWKISNPMSESSRGYVCIDVTTTENRPDTRPARRMGDE